MNLETANKLLELRKKNNLSQEDLAEKLGVSRQAISKWERGEASPNTDNLIDLANLYRISLDELLNIDVKTFLSNYGQPSNHSDININQKTIRLTKPNDFNEDEELDYMVNSNSQKIVYPKDSLDKEIYPNGNPVEDTQTIEEEYIPPIEEMETPISQVYQQSNPMVVVTPSEDNHKKKKHNKFRHTKDKKKSSPPPFTTNKFILWFERMMKKFKISYKGLYTFPYYAIAIAGAVFWDYYCYGDYFIAGSVLSIPLYYSFITAIKKRNANWFGYPILALIFMLMCMEIGYGDISALWLATIPFYYWFINKDK